MEKYLMGNGKEALSMDLVFGRAQRVLY